MNQWAKYDGKLNGPTQVLMPMAFNMLWANSILLTEVIHLCQKPMRAFCFCHQSAIYKLSGPMHQSYMAANCTANGLMWVDGLNIMAHEIGPCGCLHKIAFRLLGALVISLAGVANYYWRPMWAFCFSYQSANCTFYGPTCQSCIVANCTVDRPMWVNGMMVLRLPWANPISLAGMMHLH
jgi:hypothetical protein